MHQRIAFPYPGIDLRRTQVNAVGRQIEKAPVTGPIGDRVGPVRHTVGAHTPGEFQRLALQLLLLGLGWRAAVWEQVNAWPLVRMELGVAEPELLGAEIRELSIAGGVGEIRHSVRAHAVREGEYLLSVR